MSEDERQAWRKEARVAVFRNRFGEPVHYSGYILFVSRNMVRRRWLTTLVRKPIDDAKTMLYYDFFMTYEVTLSLFRWRAYNFPTGKRPDVYEVWLAGPYDSPGRVALENEYRYKGFKMPGFGTKDIAHAPDNKWYWLRHRFGDFSGVVAPFQTRQVFAG